jgi:CheY-like chemotaxis protein
MFKLLCYNNNKKDEPKNKNYVFLNNTLKKFMNKIITKKKEKNDLMEIQNNINSYVRCLFHDLRGPLNNISLGIDVLIETFDKTHPDYKTLQTIQISCAFLCDTLDGFSNLQDIDSITTSFVDIIQLKHQPFNIIGMINKIQMILSLHTLNKKIKIKYIYSNLNEWVIGDYKHLQQMIIMILSNMIKYSEENKSINLEINGKSIINNYQLIEIIIIDENKWIEEEIKNNLFIDNNKVSDDVNGNDLGMYICKKIVEFHDGTITHEYNTQTMNKIGNIFKITFKLLICASGVDAYKSINKITDSIHIKKNKDDSQKVLDISTPSLVPQSPHSIIERNISKASSCYIISKKNDVNKEHKHDLFSYIKNSSTHVKNSSTLDSLRKLYTSKKIIPITCITIAIVDDSDVSRKLMSRMFENNCKNIKIIECSDGLDCVIKIQYKLERIQLIMLDNIMPNITGVLLSKILRGLGFSGLIIGITGNGLIEDKDEFIISGANYVFVKPFNKEKLDRLLAFIGKYGYESVNGKVIIETSNKTLEWG